MPRVDDPRRCSNQGRIAEAQADGVHAAFERPESGSRSGVTGELAVIVADNAKHQPR